jgi:hypothetical protein
MTKKCSFALIILIISSLLVGCGRSTATPIPTISNPATRQSELAPTMALVNTAPAGTPVAVSKGLVPTVPIAGQQAAATVALQAERTSLAVNEAIEVQVIVSGVENLYGAECHLRFDPALIKIQDADDSKAGVQISPGTAFPRGASFVALNVADEQQGKMDFAATLINPAAPLSGQVMLASFIIIGKQEGSVALEFEQVLMADRHGNALPVNYTGVTFQIRP